MRIAYRNGFGSVPCTKIDRPQDRHTPRRVALIGGIIVAKLAFIIIPPTFDTVIIENGTGMRIAYCNRSGSVPCTQIDCHQGRHTPRRVALIFGIIVA